MCCDFGSTTCPTAELRTMEIYTLLVVSREGAHTFCAYSMKRFSNRNWSNPAVFFPEVDKFSTEEKRSQPHRNFAL